VRVGEYLWQNEEAEIMKKSSRQGTLPGTLSSLVIQMNYLRVLSSVLRELAAIPTG
jgi:hypothetical protein